MDGQLSVHCSVKEPKFKRPLLLVISLGIVGLPLLCLVIWYFVQSSEIIRIASRYKAAGLPFMQEDMAEKSSPGVDGDFVKNLSNPTYTGLNQWTDISVRDQVINWSVLEQDLSRINRMMSQFERLTFADNIDFGKDMDDLDRLYYEASRFYQATHAFELRARLKARRGDLDSAIEDLKTSAGLSRIYCGSDEYRQMVSRGLMRKAVEGGLRLAAERKDDPEWIKRIAVEIEGFEQVWSFEESVRGHMYNNLVGARTAQLVDPVSLVKGERVFAESDGVVIREPFGRSTLNRNWVKAQLELSMEWNTVLKMNDMTRVEQGRELERRTQNSIKRSRVSGLTIEFMSPYWEQFARDFAVDENLLVSAGLALRIWEYQMLNGRYPEDLSRLGVAVPVDPVSQDSIKYAVLDGAVVVYDFGHDGKEGLDDQASQAIWFPRRPSGTKFPLGIPGGGR